LRLSWHSKVVPADARRADTLPASTAAERTTVQTADIYLVRLLPSLRSAPVYHRHMGPNTQFTRLPESSIAPYLTELQARTKADGIRVGSYPLLSHGVYVSLIGQDREAVKALAAETAKALEGRLVSDEEAREMAKQKEKGAV
jgi:hypothetical protein